MVEIDRHLLEDYVKKLDETASDCNMFLTRLCQLAIELEKKLETNPKFHRHRLGELYSPNACYPENFGWAISTIISAWVGWIFQSNRIDRSKILP